MAFNIVKFIKGILISESATLTPKEIEIIPGGTSDTKTTITSSQTVDQTITIPDATDTLVGKNTTDLLTNKSLQDTTTAIVDNLDPTKQIKFDAEGAPMTTTLIVSAPTVDRTLMLPDATDTLVGRNTTDTLTNKTLTAPVINTPDINMGTIDGTDINNSPIGQLTPAAGSFTSLSGASIDVAGDPVVTLDAMQTLTNKTLTAPNINNPIVSGGSINDTQIGNLVPDTGAFTTLNAASLETTGDVIIGGNLTVNGTTTTLNTQTLDVEDSNITVNVNGNDVSAEGAGLTVNRTSTDGSIIYKDLSPSKFAVGPLGSEDNVVTETIVQTISNKNLVDVNTSIVDSTDPTKRITFDAAGNTNTSTRIATNATGNRVVILPDATDTLVGRNTTDTLANKTLEFLKTNVAQNVATGSNVTLMPGLNGINRLTDPGLVTIVGIQAGVQGQHLILVNNTGNSVDILNNDPAAVLGDRIFTGTNGTVTLENDASFIFTYNTDNASWYLAGGTGSGSGGGGVNFIENGNAEQTASPFEFYTSSIIGPRPAGTQTPFVGTLSITRSLLNPLAGEASWVLSKNSINGQGNNVSIPFTVDPAYKAKSIKISADYRVISGTFTPGSNIGTIQDSSVIVYIYDVDADMYIEPSNFRLLSNSTTISDHFEAEFQTNAASTNYRLLFHVASTSTLAFEVSVDNIAVSPNEYVFGTPVTDEQIQTTITIQGTTANPTKGTLVTDRIVYRRVGSNLEADYEFDQTGAGTAGSGDYIISLPAGMSFDLTKVIPYTTVPFGATSNRDAQKALIGYGHIGVTGASVGNVSIFAYSATQFRILAETKFSTYQVVSSGFYNLTNANLGFKFRLKAPIAGFSSSVQTSDQTSTRIVDFKARATAATGFGNNINFASVLKDTHAAFLTNTYTVPVPGDYSLSANIPISPAANGYAELNVFINGILFDTIARSSPNDIESLSGSTVLENLKTGDLITLRGAGFVNTITQIAFQSNASNFGTLSISRISGPSVVAATEVVAASYYASISANVPGNTPFNFNVKDIDTHNAVTTGVGVWRFTAPVSGIYSVGGPSAATGATAFFLRIYKNGLENKIVGFDAIADDTAYYGIIQLNAGDFIDLRPSATSSAQQVGAGTISTSAMQINIHKINGVN